MGTVTGDDRSAVVSPAAGLRRLLARAGGDPLVAGGLLVLAVLAAIVWANADASGYDAFWGRELTLGIGDAAITEDLAHWVGDGLMALFFLVLGLEVKHELVAGSLRHPRAAIVPILAAVGGVVVPAGIYVAFTAGGDGGRGWGIPMATDVALAVGVLALLGPRIPPGVRTFLLTLAVVDDILAVLVIAVFYADGIAVGWLVAALATLSAVGVMRVVGVERIRWYLPVGVLAWVCMLESGVHPTIAGVALGLMTPAHPVRGRDVLHLLRRRIEPSTALVVVPLFALSHAGIVLTGGVLGDAAGSGVALGVAVGLIVGKPVGIAGTALLVDRIGLGHLAEGVTRAHVVGLGALAGVGFTVSLFVAGLAFDEPGLAQLATIGVFAGSLLSAALGAALLLRATRDG